MQHWITSQHRKHGVHWKVKAHTLAKNDGVSSQLGIYQEFVAKHILNIVIS